MSDIVTVKISTNGELISEKSYSGKVAENILAFIERAKKSKL